MKRRQRILSLAIAAMMVIAFDCLNSVFAASMAAQPVQGPAKTNIAPNQKQTAGKKSAVKGIAKADHLTRARAFFAAGNYEKSLLFANADLKANPGRKTSILLMAQSYYRLGRASQSAKLFLLLSPDDLTSDAAIDCTLAMFATKRYRQATKAWLHVPAEHPYRDVARFYAGVSYMHLSLYDKALQLIRLAIKLPGNLKSDRRRLIAELDRLIERQRRGQFVGGQAYSYQTQQRYYQVPVAPPIEPAQPVAPGAPAVNPAGTASASVKKPEPQAPAKSGFVFSATPEFSYSTSATKKDFNGYSQTQGSSRSPAFNAPLQMKYAGRPRSFGGQPTFTLNVTPGYSDYEGTSTRSSLVAQESDPSAVQSVINEEADHGFSATLENGIDLLYPVNESVDIGVGYKDDHEFSNAGLTKDTAVDGPRLNIVIDGDSYKGEFKWSMYDTTDKQGDPPKVKTVMTTSGTLTRNGETSVTKLIATYVQTDATSQKGEKSRMGLNLTWDKTWDDVSLGLSAGYLSKTPYPGTVIAKFEEMNSARTQESFGGSLKWTVGFGLELTGTGKYTLLSDDEKKITNEDSSSIIISNSGTKTELGVNGAVSLGSYISVEAAFNYARRKLSVGDPEYVEAVLKDACSEQSESSLRLALRYPF